MDNETTYQCPVCKLSYKTEELAQSCEKWCKEHNSCNLDIVAHALQGLSE